MTVIIKREERLEWRGDKLRATRLSVDDFEKLEAIDIEKSIKAEIQNIKDQIKATKQQIENEKLQIKQFEERIEEY